MPGGKLKWDIKGLGFSKWRLNKLKKSGKDLTQPLDVAGQYLVSEIQSKFIDNKIKPKSQKNGQTLIEKGHLMQSIVHHISKNNVEVGTNVVYAAIHQFGGRAGRNHASIIPARPYLGISQQDKKEIRQIFINYIDKI